jgi:hypothetical protein
LSAICLDRVGARGLKLLRAAPTCPRAAPAPLPPPARPARRPPHAARPAPQGREARAPGAACPSPTEHGHHAAGAARGGAGVTRRTRQFTERRGPRGAAVVRGAPRARRRGRRHQQCVAAAGACSPFRFESPEGSHGGGPGGWRHGVREGRGGGGRGDGGGGVVVAPPHRGDGAPPLQGRSSRGPSRQGPRPGAAARAPAAAVAQALGCGRCALQRAHRRGRRRAVGPSPRAALRLHACFSGDRRGLRNVAPVTAMTRGRLFAPAGARRAARARSRSPGVRCGDHTFTRRAAILPAAGRPSTARCARFGRRAFGAPPPGGSGWAPPAPATPPGAPAAPGGSSIHSVAMAAHIQRGSHPGRAPQRRQPRRGTTRTRPW